MQKLSSPLLDEKATAKWLGMTVYWLQNARRTGLGPPYVRIGHRTVRYRPEDLREWTKRRLRTSISEERTRKAPRALA